MEYCFDEIYSRQGTNTVKYDLAKQMFGTEELIPMWVADMDLKTPDFVMEAIRQRAEHEILGYTIRGNSFFEAIINWIAARHQWVIKKEWISFSPGVVPALSMIIRAFTKPGDKIIVQAPVYFPFFHTVTNNGRQLIYNCLQYKNSNYSFDFENLKKQMDSRTKMILISSPHNPVGRVWKKEELSELAETCLRHDIIMVSDEIHSDIILHNNKHIPLASINEQVSNNTITTYAPSKTFNLAGLSTSYVIIPNQKLKATYDNFLFDLHLNNGNIFGNIALEAAYRKGEEWLKAMINYIEKNIALVRDFTLKYQDKIQLVEPESTYLLWLDFKKLGMGDENLKEFIINKAKLGLNPGTQFGQGGEGFMRMNVACSQTIVKKALSQLEQAFQSL